MRAQIQKWDGCCLVCNSPVTNPICDKCLEEEIREWLKTESPGLYTELKLRVYLKSKSNMKCIKCGKGVDICASCYTKEVYDVLSEKNKKLAEEFIEIFNFEKVPVFI